nr:hypothetical protein [Frankia sp. Cppng1_Ct_nod]
MATPSFRTWLVQDHAHKERQRVVGQQLIRLVDLAEVQSHIDTVAVTPPPS